MFGNSPGVYSTAPDFSPRVTNESIVDILLFSTCFQASGNLTCVLVFTALFVNLEQTMCGGFLRPLSRK